MRMVFLCLRRLVQVAVAEWPRPRWVTLYSTAACPVSGASGIACSQALAIGVRVVGFDIPITVCTGVGMSWC